MTTKISAPKILRNFQQERMEGKRLAYGCQKSSVKEVLKTGRASPSIYIQDEHDRRSFPRGIASFFRGLKISFQ